VQGSGTPVFLASGSTNDTGQYGFGGLMAGNYIVVTAGSHAFVNEVYDNIPCVGQREFGEGGTCAFTTIASGTPIAVTPGSVTTGVNFALAFGGAVRGTVTDASSGALLNNIMVIFLHAGTGEYAGAGFTLRGGQYLAGGLAPGDYVLFTYSFTGYLNEIFNGIQCAGLCTPATALTQGTRITVPAGGLVSGVNFALDLRTAGPPAAPREFQASVNGFNAQFNWMPPPIVAAAPATSYVLEAGLSPGTTVVSIPVVGASVQPAIVSDPPFRSVCEEPMLHIHADPFEGLMATEEHSGRGVISCARRGSGVGGVITPREAPKGPRSHRRARTGVSRQGRSPSWSPSLGGRADEAHSRAARAWPGDRPPSKTAGR
jgi:hypothetical protein